jgi:hypothetical protein
MGTERETHHIGVDVISLISWSSVQRAVFSSVVFPRSMKVIGHHMQVVQHAERRERERGRERERERKRVSNMPRSS